MLAAYIIPPYVILVKLVPPFATVTVGRSAATNERKLGAPALPLPGLANTLLIAVL